MKAGLILFEQLAKKMKIQIFKYSNAMFVLTSELLFNVLGTLPELDYVSWYRFIRSALNCCTIQVSSSFQRKHNIIDDM